MNERKISYSVWASIAILLGPLLGWLYSLIKDKTRGQFECNPNAPCIDLRSIEDIPAILGVLIITGLLACTFSLIAIKQKQSYAKIVLVVSVISLLIPIVMLSQV